MTFTFFNPRKFNVAGTPSSNMDLAGEFTRSLREILEDVMKRRIYKGVEPITEDEIKSLSNIFRSLLEDDSLDPEEEIRRAIE